jgi:hypothetical protein
MRLIWLVETAVASRDVGGEGAVVSGGGAAAGVVTHDSRLLRDSLLDLSTADTE